MPVPIPTLVYIGLTIALILYRALASPVEKDMIGYLSITCCSSIAALLLWWGTKVAPRPKSGNQVLAQLLDEGPENAIPFDAQVEKGRLENFQSNMSLRY